MPEDNFIDFKCPYCGTDTAFLDRFAGAVQECPTCEQAVIVPRQGGGAGGKVPSRLDTPRLILRRLHPEDWQDVQELMSDETVLRELEWVPLNEEETTHWLESDRHEKWTQLGHPLNLGLELRDTHKLIGLVTFFYQDDSHRQAGITVSINRAWQRQGYGTEAIRAMLVFGFSAVGLRRITASCDRRNEACSGMLLQAGLRREGDFLRDRYVKGEWVSTTYFALLAEEHHPAA